MLIIAHSFAGALIGEKFHHSLIIVAILSFLSHFLLDFIPHWSPGADYRDKLRKKLDPKVFFGLIPDSLGALAIISAVIYRHPADWLPILIGVFFALLPDILTAFIIIFKLEHLFKFYFNFHQRAQHEENRGVGIFVQIVFMSLLIVLFLKFL